MALRESGFDGLKDASDCLIELPMGGVHGSNYDHSPTKNDGVAGSLLLSSLQRFMA